MNSEQKAKLLAALRSGEYPQGRDCLLNNKGEYCCLGVAAKVFGFQIDTHRDLVVRPDGRRRNEDGHETSYAPLDDFGLIGEIRGKLISMNDSGAPFSEIADYIEANVQATEVSDDR